MRVEQADKQRLGILLGKRIVADQKQTILPVCFFPRIGRRIGVATHDGIGRTDIGISRGICTDPRRTPQRGDAREAQQGGEREERPRSAGATASG